MRLCTMADDTTASRRSSRRRSSASVVLGLLTGRRRSSALQVAPELVATTVDTVAARLSANRYVGDGELDSVPQHDVVAKLCDQLDDAFSKLGQYAPGGATRRSPR